MSGLPANEKAGAKDGQAPFSPHVELKRILAPVDFSAASRHGLAFAAALAEGFGSRLHLLYVVQPPVLPDWGYAHLSLRDVRLGRAAEERLVRLPLESGINAALIDSTEVRSGEPEFQICQAAAEGRVDLVVLASHGLGGLPHAFSGSTSERVVRRAPCPVLTVRDRTLPVSSGGAFSLDLKRILVTTDFSAASKEAFPHAAFFARKFDASLLLLYVVPGHLPAELSHFGFVLEERQLMDKARAELPRFRDAEFDLHLKVDTAVLQGGPAHAICQTARNQEADLIVMATHGHTGFKHFLIGSVTEKVVRHAPCPVLVVRSRKPESPTKSGMETGQSG